MALLNQDSFSGGEWSPAAHARVSLERHSSACRVLKNAVVGRTGNAFKRWPTQYLVHAVNQTSSWLLPYRLRQYGEFMLEFYDTKIRVFPNAVIGGQQGEDMVNWTINWSIEVQGFGHVNNAITLDCPLTAAQLVGLQSVQAGNTLYIAGSNSPVVGVTFTGASWHVRIVEFRNLVADALPKIRTLRPAGPSGWTDIAPMVDDAPLSAADIFRPTDTPYGIWRIGGDDLWYKSNTYLDTRRELVSGLFANSDTDDPPPVGYVQTAPQTSWVGPWVAEGAQDGIVLGTILTTPQLSIGLPVIPPGGLVTTPNQNIVINAPPGNYYFTARHLGALLELDPDNPGAGLFMVRVGFIEALDNPNGSGGYQTATFRVIDRQPAAVYTTPYNAHRFRFLRDRGQPVGSNGHAMFANGLTGSVRVAIMPNNSDELLAVFDSSSIGQPLVLNGGRLTITSVIDAFQAVGTVDPLTPLRWRGPSLDWSFTSGVAARPRAIAYHQDRLWLGGIPESPNRLFGSRVGEYEDFTVAADDPAAGLLLSVAAEVGGGVQWMRSATDLLVGTEDAVYAVRGQPITSESLGVDLQVALGSENVNPIMVDGNVCFVTRGGRELRIVGTADTTERYQAQSLVDAAAHLFAGSRIKQMVYMQTPEQVLVTLLEDGSVKALSYRPESGVLAWSAWDFLPGHRCLSIALRRPNHVDRDEVWAIFERPVYETEAGDTTKRLIERWNPDAGPRMDAFSPIPLVGPAVQVAYMFSGQRVQTFTPPNPPSLNGPIYLGDFDVARGTEPAPQSPNGLFTIGMIIAADGVSVQEFGPAVTYGELCVGYQIPFELRPQRIQSRDGRGSTVGRKHVIRRARLLIINSHDGEVQGEKIRGDWLDVQALSPLNGWVDFPGVRAFGNDDDADLIITHNNPLTFEVAALTAEVDVGE